MSPAPAAPLPRSRNQPLDLQINGYAGVDFNVDGVAPEHFRQVCERLAADGIGGILATVITAPVDAMVRRVRAIARAVATDPVVAQRIVGIHVEGPFISNQPGYVGAHPRDAVRVASVDVARQVIDAAQGLVRIWTLAPEMDPGAEVTGWLADSGVVVAAGHTDATLDQLRRALDSGLKMFTHLGNGCPPTMHRHDNIIQRVLHLADRLHISLVADGHHLPPYVLSNFLRWIPDQHILIVSDAIAAAGMGPGTYALAGQQVHVDPDRATWNADRTQFAGSATSLARMRAILGKDLQVPRERIDQWTIENPHRLVGVGA